MDDGTRGRGRPSVIDPDAVAEAALRLWAERGYAATGWKELAEATGVSARTLMRHYGTRDRIAWTEVESANGRLAGAIEHLDPDLPIAEALRRIVVASISHDPFMRSGVPAWVRLIASEPEFAATAAAANRAWTGLLEDFLDRRLPGAPRAARQAIAAAYEAATITALAAWADAGAAVEPADAVDAALRWLGVAEVAGGAP
ncbi:TetR/AcrR family transcriptional regulator [Agromyces seonyuensis]|uniref:TetR family transcriptional regulator n=1 Tax=Agromyces seonyuensis TaxID=2662446 RepID=A0A6I4P1L3_9MICO|nr:TetR/AcrR family transcriptional regulator [Agromyces seonyuensis]MWB97117.1 TetR family transcriptional regulator [Agromyces seonyuensis]